MEETRLSRLHHLETCHVKQQSSLPFTLLYLIIQMRALIWTGVIETKSYIYYFAQLVLFSFAPAAMVLVSFPRRSTALSRTQQFLMY